MTPHPALSAVLFAADSDMPAGKAIAILAFFGVIGVVSTVLSFAPNTVLRKMAGFIGTENPLVARIVCILCALVGLGASCAAVLSLTGQL